MLPHAHASWEQDGTIDDVAAIARAADRLGVDYLTCSEHVVVPAEVAPTRGSRYWDPLATFGYLAAVTSDIRFSTNVLVLGYHHPLEIAKRYGTLDRVCGGRLILGLGVGSLDDAISALRASLSVQQPEYDGTYYRFSGMVLDPCALQASVPLWIGGRTARSLRRAVTLGDGWVPFGIRAVDTAAMLAAARDTPAWAERRRPLEILLQNGRPIDPVGDPDGSTRAIRRLTDAGATGLQLNFVHHSVSHYLEQLEAVVDLVGRADAGLRPG
jgi:alkanesulfonate monooxygenase SsuD/methylene tetrahydromethanopterin reductase-like flavin-dependent oxidoreductase (luciferase family)